MEDNMESRHSPAEEDGFLLIGNYLVVAGLGVFCESSGFAEDPLPAESAGLEEVPPPAESVGFAEVPPALPEEAPVPPGAEVLPEVPELPDAPEPVLPLPPVTLSEVDVDDLPDCEDEDSPALLGAFPPDGDVVVTSVFMLSVFSEVEQPASTPNNNTAAADKTAHFFMCHTLLSQSVCSYINQCTGEK
ncbi:hypothetical protein [Paenibacillus hamazuiensis]|uniref:hypothetical protein n=1 Tax=Paenibacillus hamazuiensis TaxID=2936508 RepID=UPI00200E97B6|nr:hypothetical protein [Paenibacillus hamazuiensis]